MFTGLMVKNILTGHSRFGRIGDMLIEPIDLTYNIISSISKTGTVFSAFQSNKYVSYNKSDTLNNLKNDLFILHDRADNTGFEIINLKNQQVRVFYPYPESFTFNNINDRVKLTSNDNFTRVYGFMGNQLLIYPVNDLNNAEVVRFEDFSFHHRIEVFNNFIYANVRRRIQIEPSLEFIADEGYVKLSDNGDILDVWWLSEHLNEIRKITPLGSLISTIQGSRDPFHINDIEVSTLVGNRLQTEKIDSADIFISVRHFNSILWLKSDSIYKVLSGSYNQQHDVDIINDSIISISNNNSGANHVNIENVTSNVVFQNVNSLHEIIKYENVGFSTYSEGQVQFIDDGRILIENQNEHEFIVVLNDQVVFRNGIKSTSKIGYNEILSWSPVINYNTVNNLTE